NMNVPERERLDERSNQFVMRDRFMRFRCFRNRQVPKLISGNLFRSTMCDESHMESPFSFWKVNGNPEGAAVRPYPTENCPHHAELPRKVGKIVCVVVCFSVCK